MLSLCEKVYKDDLTILSDDGTTAKINIKRPILGVPITFMDKYNPSSIIERHNLGKEFDIIGEAHHGSDNEYDLFKPILDGKEKYVRILIRVKPGITTF